MFEKQTFSILECVTASIMTFEHLVDVEKFYSFARKVSLVFRPNSMLVKHNRLVPIILFV